MLLFQRPNLRLPVSFWNRRQQGARFSDDAVLELRVAHDRGAEHRMAFFVEVNTGHAWFIHEHFRDYGRGELRGAPLLDVRSKQREDVFCQEAQEDVGIAPEAGGRTESRFDRVEVQAWRLAGKLQCCGEGALLRGGVGVRAWHLRSAWIPLTARARLRGDITATTEARHLGWFALGIFYVGGDKDDVRAVGEMRDERFGQHERSDVVRRERIVPAQRVLRSAHREDARVVEQPDN